MSEATKTMIRKWVAMCHGDVELCARFMRDKLRLCGIKQARAWIQEAQQ
jgi:hypothetical protein